MSRVFTHPSDGSAAVMAPSVAPCRLLLCVHLVCPYTVMRANTDHKSSKSAEKKRIPRKARPRPSRTHQTSSHTAVHTTDHALSKSKAAPRPRSQELGALPRTRGGAHATRRRATCCCTLLAAVAVATAPIPNILLERSSPGEIKRGSDGCHMERQAKDDKWCDTASERPHHTRRVSAFLVPRLL